MADYPNNEPSQPPSGSNQLLRYELTPIDDLKPAARNARKHSKAQLAALARSMASFGIVSPVIRDADNVIVAGHGRVAAARKLGHQVIPTLLLDKLTEAQRRVFALADNAIQERATWDELARAEELRDLRFEVPDLDLTLTGLEHPVIELAIAGLEQTDWSDLDQHPEESSVRPVTRLGDIWDFSGGHTLVCGDSTSAETVAAAVGGETVQLVEQDAPYNRPAKDYSGKGRFRHENFRVAAGEMSQEEFRTFLAASYAAVKPHLADGALIYSFMDGRHIGDLIDAGERAAFELKYVLAWDKGVAGLGGMYRHAHELIALFKHGTAPHVNNVTGGKKQGRDRQTIWRYPGMNRFGPSRDRALALHATIKPVQMLCDLLLDASRAGDVVFDGFGGSGSTLIAAAKMGRRGKLIELEERYCDAAIERFQLAFGEYPVERKTGLTFSQLAALRDDAGSREDGNVQ